MNTYRTELPGGKHVSFVMRHGSALKLTDIEGCGNAGLLFYNPQNLLERYNAPDTLKCQHSFFLTAGHCLYSDMGRIFCTIIADDLGWHDTVCGTTDGAFIAARWGSLSYQDALNDWRQGGRESFLIEALKYGLGKRDLAANVNFFSKVTTAEDGTLSFATGHSRAGASVTLRFEMDTLVLLHSCAHPLDPSHSYPCHPIGMEFIAASAETEPEPSILMAEENRRGFANNALYHQFAGKMCVSC